MLYLGARRALLMCKSAGMQSPQSTQDLQFTTWWLAPNIPAFVITNEGKTIRDVVSGGWYHAKSETAANALVSKYFEIKIDETISGGSLAIGIAPQGTDTAWWSGRAGESGRVQYDKSGARPTGGGNTAAYGSPFSTGDIIGCSVESSGANTVVRFYKNGVDQGPLLIPTSPPANWEPQISVYHNAAYEVDQLTFPPALLYLPPGFESWSSMPA